MTDDDRKTKALEQVDPEKRDFIRKVATGTAFAVPAVASFSMDGLTLNRANAATSNSTFN
jgi:hypothetical protein